VHLQLGKDFGGTTVANPVEPDYLRVPDGFKNTVMDQKTYGYLSLSLGLRFFS
jgi:hypothetical protein